MSDLDMSGGELPASLQQFAEKIEPEVKSKPEEKSEPAEQGQEISKVEPEVKTDPMVEKAKASGWRPKEEWQGDPDQWVDAGEFVRREPLFKELKAAKKEQKELRERIESVSKYAATAAENERKRVLAEIEAERLAAVEMGDTEAFKAADKKLQEVQKEEIQKPTEPKEPEIPESVQEFSNRNKNWFEKDKAMTVFMVETTKEYRQQGLSLDEAIEKAESDVKREFAHKFVNPNKEKPAAVGSNNSESRPAAMTQANLTREQRAVWSSLKHHMTFEEFAKGLKAEEARK